MRLGGGLGFVCDNCGVSINYPNKCEITYKRYAYDDTYKIAKSMAASSVCAYDFCEKCFLKADKKLRKLNNTRPEHRPAEILERRYSNLLRKMYKAYLEHYKKGE